MLSSNHKTHSNFKTIFSVQENAYYGPKNMVIFSDKIYCEEILPYVKYGNFFQKLSFKAKIILIRN